MLLCPCCARRSVPLGSAWRSSVTRPARCAACGATCYVQSSASGVPLLLAVCVVVSGAALAAALQAFAVLALSGVAAAAAYVLLWRHVRPVAVTAMACPARSKTPAGLAWLELLAFLVLWK